MLEKNKSNYIIYSLLAILLLTSVGLNIYNLVLLKKNANTEIKYIDLERVYNEFVLKKELESRLFNLTTKQEEFIDSLKIVFNNSEESSITIRTDKGYQNVDIELLENIFENERIEIAVDYDAKVWTQLNQYIRDFGESRAISFILGASGDGSLMYGNMELDITSEMIKYVNNRFKGGEK